MTLGIGAYLALSLDCTLPFAITNSEPFVLTQYLGL